MWLNELVRVLRQVGGQRRLSHEDHGDALRLHLSVHDPIVTEKAAEAVDTDKAAEAVDMEKMKEAVTAP